MTAELRAIIESQTKTLDVLSLISKGDLHKDFGEVGTEGVKAWQVWSNGAQVLMSRYEAGASWPKHAHSSIEYLIVVSGTFRVTFHLLRGDSVVVVRAPDFTTVLNDVVHSVEALTDGQLMAVLIPPDKGYQ